MEKHTIIKLKMEGYSNRQIAKMCCVNRKTVARYWNEYIKQQTLLDSASSDTILTIQEAICSPPTYRADTRKPRRYTKELDAFLDELLEREAEKCKLLGSKKQSLTQLQLYHLVIEQGFVIGKTTVTNKIRERELSIKNALFVRIMSMENA